jgi:cold shock CspA family protein
MNMQKARCTYWSERGYGFLRPLNQREADIFVHVSALVNAEALEVGDVVSFEKVFSQRTGKDQAANVQVVK